MRKNIESRVAQLERHAEDSREPVPGMIYISPHQTFEEAAAKYEQRHGFKLPENAKIIRIVAYDASRKTEAID